MLWCAAQVISAAFGVWALIDSALRPAQYYAAADKRSKNFWVAVNAVAAVVGTFLAYEALRAVYLAGASTGGSFIGQRRLLGGRAPRAAGADAGTGALIDPDSGAGLAASPRARWRCRPRTARLEPWSLMRAVIQRVNRAAVRVDGEVVGEITRPGLMVLVGATHDDGPKQVATVARKIADLRLMEDELSVSDAGAPVLVVSQFTLYADTRKGRRPTWNKAAPGEVAEPLVEAGAEDLRGRGLEVATGRFGAHMAIDMEADGPVTILVEAE